MTDSWANEQGGDICICYRDSFSKLFYINNSDQTKEVMTSKYSEDCKFTAFHLELMDKGKLSSEMDQCKSYQRAE